MNLNDIMFRGILKQLANEHPGCYTVKTDVREYFLAWDALCFHAEVSRNQDHRDAISQVALPLLSGMIRQAQKQAKADVKTIYLVTGPTCSGKTTFTTLIKQKADIKFLDLDAISHNGDAVIRKDFAGWTIPIENIGMIIDEGYTGFAGCGCNIEAFALRLAFECIQRGYILRVYNLIPDFEQYNKQRAGRGKPTLLRSAYETRISRYEDFGLTFTSAEALVEFLTK